MADVRELRARTDEYLLTQDDPVPNTRMTLDSRAGADDRATRHEAKRADDDVRADGRSFDNDRRRMDSRGYSQARAAVHRVNMHDHDRRGEPPLPC